MPNTIRIKRRPSSGAAGKPSSLFNGELAFNENDNILYYGYGSGVGASIEQIGGSGYFAHRGGINASGLWPVSVTGNAGTVTNGVYTTGDQTVNGLKTFGNPVTFNSGISLTAINTSSNNVGYFAVFDSNPASSTQTLKSVSKSDVLDDIGGASSGIDMTAGSGLFGGGNLTASRTFNVGQGDGITVSADSIAVDSTVVRTTGNQTITGTKTISNSSLNFDSDSSILFEGIDDESNPVNFALSGPQGIISGGMVVFLPNDSGVLALDKRNMIAGSGLIGGGDLSANRTFDINTGDGIQIVSDAVAVNNTVVRTTGVQSVDGIKTFGNISIFNSGILASGTTSIRSAATASTATQFAVFTSSPASSSQSILTRTPSEVKTDIGLNNVTNDAQVKKLASTSGGFVPTWNGTTGDALNIGYSVETTLTGGAGALPRADAVKTYVDNMIVSGIATNDAMVFKGALDCSTNPNYPAADRGWVYKISVAGRIGGASGPVVEVNDTIICGTDGTATGTHAAVGSNWNILQTNIVDASILVTGPASATSGNFAIFDGATGKIVRDAGFAATTVGQSLVSLTNPGAITFLRVNANNTVTARSASDFKTDLSLNNVENTALSTWAGSANITTLGTIASGTWSATTIAVNKGGTGQTSYTDGQLLIGNSTGNTLSKATLTAGTSVDITNGNGSITIGHADTSTLTGAQGGNGIAAFTLDGLGHVTAVTTATYLTAGTVCAAIADCTLDGGSF
jgi:hypothetical protein